MKMRISSLCAFAVLLPVFLASAQSDALKADARYATALRAMADGLPDVAILKLREISQPELAIEDRAAVNLKLAQALMGKGQNEDALKLLDGFAGEQQPEIAFTRATALAALGRWNESYPLYQHVAGDEKSPFFVSAKLGEAESLHALGKTPEAPPCWKRWPRMDALATGRGCAWRISIWSSTTRKNATPSCVPSSRSQPRKRSPSNISRREFLLPSNVPKAALANFEELIKEPQGLPENILVGATLGAAESRAALNGPESADDVIEDFIRQHPDSRSLGVMFLKLDAL